MKYFFGLLVVLSYGSHGFSLTLDEAVQKGLATSEDLTIRKLEIDLYKENLSEIQSTLYPKISGSAQFMHYLEKPVITIPEGTLPAELPFSVPDEIPIAQDYAGEASLTVQQVIYTFGAISKGIEAARQSINLGKTVEESAQDDLREAIKNAYFDALAADRALQIARDSLKNAKESEALLSQGVRGGRSSQSDLIRIRSDIQIRRPAVTQKKLQRDLAYDYLRFLIGAKKDEPLKLSEKLQVSRKVPTSSELESKMIANQPKLKALQQKADLFRASAAATEASFNPTLAAFGNLTVNAQSEDINADNLQTVSAIGLQLNFKLYDGGTNSSQKQQQMIESKKAEQELKLSSRQLKLGLNRALASVNTLKEILAEIDQALTLADRSYKISLKRFRVGQTTPLELNDVERSLTQLKETRLDALLKLNKAYVTIEKLTGVAI
ncbi:TolC family protein [Pseudobacteriovorax antillogorgiicola]|uniref:Outer membrane protein TolC n=1 Tax=Pseudobacteriovorax antillogorgiicola TaxID=1513793 RepID=A0A1Y6BAM9_9BACT|nr:TolC family protein [Pseudobacteriovorax antillogorgiicola]TCS57394.1 outer membrane protein TolC [Pseudobacteriovorax antillogorgiicola]SMF01614.1 Outer membrane protein TolC [Pseudobacteriovorax antillogorgiicola]